MLRAISDAIGPGPKISILIPFSSTNPTRKANFEWVCRYWKFQLPDAEIVIGVSKSHVFCKGEAINDAVRRSRGKVLAILDADAYMSGEIIEHCADMILSEKTNHLWYIPYRRLYRLTEETTAEIIGSHPSNPYTPAPIRPDQIENNDTVQYGHRYAAMAIVIPREAHAFLGGLDERFKGWGGEDICLMRALDTLYGKHKTVRGDIYHLWHPFNGNTYESRRWDGQESGGSNWTLSKRYGKAVGNPSMMREVIFNKA